MRHIKSAVLIAAAILLFCQPLSAAPVRNEGEPVIRAFFECINRGDPYGAMELMDTKAFFTDAQNRPDTAARIHWKAVFDTIDWVVINMIIPDRFEDWTGKRQTYKVTFTINPRSSPGTPVPDNDWHSGRNSKWFELRRDPYDDKWRIDNFTTDQ